MTTKSKRKQLTDEEAVKAFEKAFEGVNFDEQPRGEATLAPVPKAHEQHEPFTYYRHYDGGVQDWPDEKTTPLYTFPPASKPWVGLTDDEIHDIYDAVAKQEPYAIAVTRRNIGRAIEAKLRERNEHKEKNA